MDALTTFAPAYFKYMNECLDENVSLSRPSVSLLPPRPKLTLVSIRTQRPTALAKIFGVYKLGYKSPSRTMRMNVMVMVCCRPSVLAPASTSTDASSSPSSLSSLSRKTSSTNGSVTSSTISRETRGTVTLTQLESPGKSCSTQTWRSVSRPFPAFRSTFADSFLPLQRCGRTRSTFESIRNES